MTESETAGTGQGLFDFLEWAGSRGEMVKTTAQSRLASCRAVLGVFDDPASVDLRTLDMASTLSRFETLNRLKYSSGSLSTYQRRFETSVALYLAWEAGNDDWKQAGQPASESGGTKSAKSSNPRRTRKAPESAPSAAATSQASTEAPSSSRQLIPYDLPLRPNLIVRLNLPVEMTTSDADRIATFVRSLAFSTLPADRRDEPQASEGG